MRDLLVVLVGEDDGGRVTGAFGVEIARLVFIGHDLLDFAFVFAAAVLKYSQS